MAHENPSPAPSHDDLKRVTNGIRSTLQPDETPWPGGYPDEIELALIDAVLSIRARYGQPDSGVRGQVKLWKAHRGGSANDLRALATGDLAAVLTNRQRVSQRLKVDVIQEAASALSEAGINTAADVRSDALKARRAYCSVRGLGNVTFNYMTMLIGTDTIKADTWILRFLRQVLDRQVSPDEAEVLITAAARDLQRPAREVDHEIWLYMRGGGAN